MSLGQIGCDSKSRMDALFGARYYDPMMSSWISTDPALEDYLPTGAQLFFPEQAFNANSLKGAGGVFNSKNVNTYQYAANNPVKFVDPDGRSPKLAEKVIDKSEQSMKKMLETAFKNLNNNAPKAVGKGLSKILSRTLGVLGLLIPTEIGDSEQKMPVFHYTDKSPAEWSGLLPAESYVTPEGNYSKKAAKSKLSLKNKPQYRLKFEVKPMRDLKNAPNSLPGNIVAPANGESGGGTEFLNRMPLQPLEHKPILEE